MQPSCQVGNDGTNALDTTRYSLLDCRVIVDSNHLKKLLVERDWENLAGLAFFQMGPATWAVSKFPVEVFLVVSSDSILATIFDRNSE